MNEAKTPETRKAEQTFGAAPLLGLIIRIARLHRLRPSSSGIIRLYRVFCFKVLHLGLVSYLRSRILLLKALNLFLVLWYPCQLLLYRFFLDVRFFIHVSLFWLFGIYVDGVDDRPNITIERRKRLVFFAILLLP